MRRWLLIVILASGYGLQARAEAPPVVPVQGVLTDSTGAGIDGDVQVRFAIYDSDTGGNELWAETQTVPVSQGLFSTYLGWDQPLDLSLMRDNSALYLGVSVAGDPEMGRLYLGSTPFAAYAEYNGLVAGEGITISAENLVSGSLGDTVEGSEVEDGSLQLADLGDSGCSPGQIARWNGSAWACSDDQFPTGAVMFFHRADCPPGWSELPEAQGRTLLGLPAGGQLAGVSGSPLSDLGLRTISEVVDHSHPVDPPAFSTAQTGSHAHGIDDPGHTHDMPDWSGSGSGHDSLIDINADTYNPFPTSPNPTGITIQNAGAHVHDADPDPYATGSAGTAHVDVGMPYLQLLVCRKD